MTKREFNQIRELIVNICNDQNLDGLCYYYGITKADFYEFVDELALIGFKEKYNQHNHKEHNKNIGE